MIQTWEIVSCRFCGEMTLSEIVFYSCACVSHNSRSFMLSVYMVVSDTDV